MHLCACIYARTGEQVGRPTAVELQSVYNVQNSHVQEFHDIFKRYVTLAGKAGVAPIPKLHLAAHLVHRSSFAGSPNFATTFLDESLNGDARDMAAGLLSRTTWYRRFFSFWRRMSAKGKRPLDD